MCYKNYAIFRLTFIHENSALKEMIVFRSEMLLKSAILF